MRPRKHCVALVLTLGGCSWVQLSDPGSQVTQARPADVANCQQMGMVSANTKSRVMLKRGAAKVQEELFVLARNRAADIGANAIVPIGEPENGTQSFRAYLCD